MTNDTTNAKGFTMDNFTFGMFADAAAYDAAREEIIREQNEENWVEPMDWTDVLNNHNRGLDALERELADAERAEDDDDDRYDFLNQWD